MNGSVETRVLALLDDAMDQPSATRADWIADRCGADHVLRDRALALLAAGGGALRTGGGPMAAGAEPPPARIGAYRIAGLIGQGGMGAVYRGERAAGDFDHVAAIKVIRPGALSEALVERFQRERQTLAKLSHPHIARLFDGGETAEGQPYIVMEHVDGLPLDGWIAANAPSRAKRLALFLDICSAVGFAHQNLVIHRDITPSNILVTHGGIAKLIDFGIARPPDPGSTTQRSSLSLAGLSLTPGFAAPERLAGGSATTLSDVYSLGVLLERMLPNDPDRDTAAIVARASAADPEERYTSVDALADDVMRLRDGRAVAARRGGRGYLVGKFVTRHRAAVSAAAVALVLLVGALAMTLVANRRAEVARAEAEDRFQQTRAIAKTLLFDAYNEVSKVPGSTPARAMLADAGQTYLTALAQIDNAPLDVRLETGLGFLRLSQVTGNGGDGQLGKLEEGGKLVLRAQSILQPAYAQNPTDPAAIRAYAKLLFENVARALYTDNDPEEALRKAVQLRKVLRPISEPDSESARLWAGSWQGTGDSYAWTEDYERARQAYLIGDRYINTLPPALREAKQVQMVRSANLRLLGEAYHNLKQVEPARATLDRAVAVNRQLVAAEPNDPVLIRKLTMSLHYRAVVHRTNGRDGPARGSIDEALALARMLNDRSGGDSTSLQLIAQVGEVYAQVLGDMNRFAQSFTVGEEVIAAHRKLVSLAGDTAGARRILATALVTHGGNLYNGASDLRACATWREARAIFADLDTRGALTTLDRNGNVSDLERLLREHCSGTPRPGKRIPI